MRTEVRTEAALLYICVYSKETRNWISQTFLTMPKTINTESFIEVCEEERCLWDVSSVIYKNCQEKAKIRRKLGLQFSVTLSQKNCIFGTNSMFAGIKSPIFGFVLVCFVLLSSWRSPQIHQNRVVSCAVVFCTLIYLPFSILVLASHRSLDCFSSLGKFLPTRIFFYCSCFFLTNCFLRNYNSSRVSLSPFVLK